MWKARLWVLRFPRKRKIPALGVGGIFFFLHFHGPATAVRNGVESRRFACYMRCAASVSLRVPAMRCKTAGVSPGRRYCAGLGKANRVSSGV
jgi:hypothetical protein